MTIDAHRRMREKGVAPKANFKTLVNKNAIKPKSGGPPGNCF